MGFLVVAALAAVLAGVAWRMARNAERKRGRMLATETSTVATLTTLAGAAAGSAGAGSYRELVELAGTVAFGPGGALTSPETRTDCAWFRHGVTRRYTQVAQDKDGKRTTSTAEEVVTDECSDAVFSLRDGTGEILVQPHGWVEGARKSTSQFREGRRGGDRHTIGFEHEEWVLEAGTRLFVSGEVSDESGVLVLRKPTDGELVITTKSEGELLESAGQAARWWATTSKVSAVAAGVLAIVGVVSLVL